MRALKNNSKIQLNNSRLTEFCHTPREAYQKIRAANNRLAIPPDLSILINGIACPDTESETQSKKRANISRTDIFLIEISSVRRLTLHGYELQLNFVRDYFVNQYGLEEWFAELCDKSRGMPNGTKTRHTPKTKGINVPPHVIQWAALIEMSIEPDEAISTTIANIVNYIKKPIIFVGHFDVRKPDGQRVVDRVRLNKCIKSSAETNGAGYFEPSSLIGLAGADLALRDNNHWADDFLEIAGRHILENHITPKLREGFR